MAVTMYGLTKNKFLSAGIDLLTDDIKVLLVDSADYTPDFDTDEFHADIPSGAIVGTSANLATKSLTLGVFDADPVTAAAVTGDPFEYLILFKDTGSSATSPLIVLIDGVSYTPFGASIEITWDNGASKIFRLGDC